MLLFVTAVCVSLSPADGGWEVHPARRCKLQLLAPAHSAAGRPARRDRARLGGRQGDVQWRNSEEADVPQYVPQSPGRVSVPPGPVPRPGPCGRHASSLQVRQDRAAPGEAPGACSHPSVRPAELPAAKQGPAGLSLAPTSSLRPPLARPASPLPPAHQGASPASSGPLGNVR